MVITIGTVGKPGCTILSPSMAEETVMGGVIIPSAKSAQPPIIAGIISHFAFLFTKEYKEKIPPSPLLSARSVISTYFRVVCNVKVQKIHDKPPRIKSVVMILSPTMALNT